jgi:hypothetical protein
MNHDFTPFAMDIFGAMGKSTHALVKRLAVAISDKSNIPIWLAKTRIRQRLVATNQKALDLALECQF